MRLMIRSEMLRRLEAGEAPEILAAEKWKRLSQVSKQQFRRLHKEAKFGGAYAMSASTCALCEVRMSEDRMTTRCSMRGNRCVLLPEGCDNDSWFQDAATALYTNKFDKFRNISDQLSKLITDRYKEKVKRDKAKAKRKRKRR